MKSNVVICGDCLPIMRDMPDNCVDLIVTDPNYGIGVAKHGTVGGSNIANVTDYGNQDWDNKPCSDDQIAEMIRISNNQVIFGGNYFNLPPSPCWLVWDKDNSGNFADCELAWTSFKTAVRKFKWRWNGMLQEKMGKQKEVRFHPTQKPVPLMEWIISNYSKEGDLICDPFCGSGSTLVAAKNLGRRYIGIELDSKYVAICNERLSQQTLEFK
jgi:site-specific DNA-methyltransferase (adenine-specific)